MDFRKGLLFATFSIALCFTGCSTRLTTAQISDQASQATPITAFDAIPVFYGGDTLYLDKKLQNAYGNALGDAFANGGQCHGEAKIRINVVENSAKSAWTLPLAFIPFWPIMPVDEAWQVSFEASIFCENTLVSHVQFEEEERVHATIYGRLRSDLANQAMEEIHRKLTQRLSFEVKQERPADLNSVQDYTLY